MPGLRGQYKEHTLDYGELLPRVLMGDFTRWFIQMVRTSRDGISDRGDSERGVVERAAAFLGAGYETRGPALRELIAASFPKSLWQAEGDYGGGKSKLGANLREGLANLEEG